MESIGSVFPTCSFLMTKPLFWYTRQPLTNQTYFKDGRAMNCPEAWPEALRSKDSNPDAHQVQAGSDLYAKQTWPCPMSYSASVWNKIGTGDDSVSLHCASFWHQPFSMLAGKTHGAGQWWQNFILQGGRSTFIRWMSKSKSTVSMRKTSNPLNCFRWVSSLCPEINEKNQILSNSLNVVPLLPPKMTRYFLNHHSILTQSHQTTHQQCSSAPISNHTLGRRLL